MKKLFLVNLSLLILNVFMLLAIFPQGMATPAPNPKFLNVVPFATSGGYLGFLNQNDGAVYIYDGFLKECVLISRIENLGQPMRKIK